MKPLIVILQHSLFLNLLLLVTVELRGQITNAQAIHPYSEQELHFTTPEYRKIALSLMIEEANRIAQQLHLDEDLPITTNKLKNRFIVPPMVSALGSITTRKYEYYIRAMGRRFGALDCDIVARTDEATQQYRWPIDQLDTNTAFQVAKQFMAAVSFDVNALNSDCSVDVDATYPFGYPAPKYFVPEYHVTWQKHGHRIAWITFLLPTKTVWTIQMLDNKYNLRKNIEIPNLEQILRDGGAPKSLLQKMGFETNSVVNGAKR